MLAAATASELNPPMQKFDSGLQIIVSEQPDHGSDARRVWVKETGFIVFSTCYSSQGCTAAREHRLKRIRDMGSPDAGALKTAALGFRERDAMTERFFAALMLLAACKSSPEVKPASNPELTFQELTIASQELTQFKLRLNAAVASPEPATLEKASYEIVVDSNAFHYRDPSGGPWRYVPWDLDATLGQDWQTRRTLATSKWEMTSANRLFARMLADPQLGAALRQRYRTLLQNELSVDTVVALVDRYAAEVREAALRDERKWQRQHRSYRLWADRTDFNDHLQEVDYLRRWIRERWSALSSRY